MHGRHSRTGANNRTASVLEADDDRLEAFVDAFNASPPHHQSLERSPYGRVDAKWFRCLLTSVFQPIVDAKTSRVVGHEALVRCRAANDVSLSPWGIFSLAGTPGDLVTLDRLCRTLHTLNYLSQVRDGLSLFVNVQMGLLRAVQRGFGRDFEERLACLGIRPSNVVIELPAEAVAQRTLMTQAIRDYQSRGYRVALAYPQGGERWLQGLRGVRADIVKIDQRGLRDPVSAREAATAIHDARAVALAEKIETAEQEARARGAGFDLLQGCRRRTGCLRCTLRRISCLPCSCSDAKAQHRQPPAYFCPTR